MIRKRVRETVRKNGEQPVYEDDGRGQGEILGETAGATCQPYEDCTQEIGMDGFIPMTTSSQVRVLSFGERGILRRFYLAGFFLCLR